MSIKTLTLAIVLLGIGAGGGAFIGYDFGFEKAANQFEPPLVQSSSTPAPTFDQKYFDILTATFANEYNAKVILLGGLGSHQVQLSAYTEGGNSYLNPPEDWVTTSFTRAGAIWVNCRAGYTVKACGVNNSEVIDGIDTELGCYYEAEQLREDIEIRCVQSH